MQHRTITAKRRPLEVWCWRMCAHLLLLILIPLSAVAAGWIHSHQSPYSATITSRRSLINRNFDLFYCSTTTTSKIPFSRAPILEAINGDDDEKEEPTAAIGVTNNNNDYQEEEPNHLITAGHYFKGIDEDVGNAMCRAGVAWSSDWSQVAEALEEAANAFWDTLSKKNISPKLQTICRSVAQELEDISTIEGCSSVGPASSLPNWIAIHGYLTDAAAAYKDYNETSADDATNNKNKNYYEILTKTSQEVEKLIESII